MLCFFDKAEIPLVTKIIRFLVPRNDKENKMWFCQAELVSASKI